jgi:hypothetical protein
MRSYFLFQAKKSSARSLPCLTIFQGKAGGVPTFQYFFINAKVAVFLIF